MFTLKHEISLITYENSVPALQRTRYMYIAKNNLLMNLEELALFNVRVTRNTYIHCMDKNVLLC